MGQLLDDRVQHLTRNTPHGRKINQDWLTGCKHLILKCGFVDIRDIGHSYLHEKVILPVKRCASREHNPQEHCVEPCACREHSTQSGDKSQGEATELELTVLVSGGHPSLFPAFPGLNRLI